jgi:hypothetical protein
MLNYLILHDVKLFCVLIAITDSLIVIEHHLTRKMRSHEPIWFQDRKVDHRDNFLVKIKTIIERYKEEEDL